MTDSISPQTSRDTHDPATSTQSMKGGERILPTGKLQNFEEGEDRPKALLKRGSAPLKVAKLNKELSHSMFQAALSLAGELSDQEPIAVAIESPAPGQTDGSIADPSVLSIAELIPAGQNFKPVGNETALDIDVQKGSENPISTSSLFLSNGGDVSQSKAEELLSPFEQADGASASSDRPKKSLHGTPSRPVNLSSPLQTQASKGTEPSENFWTSFDPQSDGKELGSEKSESQSANGRGENLARSPDFTDSIGSDAAPKKDALEWDAKRAPTLSTRPTASPEELQEPIDEKAITPRPELGINAQPPSAFNTELGADENLTQTSTRQAISPVVGKNQASAQAISPRPELGINAQPPSAFNTELGADENLTQTSTRQAISPVVGKNQASAQAISPRPELGINAQPPSAFNTELGADENLTQTSTRQAISPVVGKNQASAQAISPRPELGINAQPPSAFNTELGADENLTQTSTRQAISPVVGKNQASAQLVPSNQIALQSSGETGDQLNEGMGAMPNRANSSIAVTEQQSFDRAAQAEDRTQVQRDLTAKKSPEGIQPDQLQAANLTSNHLAPTTVTNASSTQQVSAAERVDAAEQIISQMVSAVSQIEQLGRTDTVVNLNHPPQFRGVQLIVSEYDSAGGELNLTFANVKNPQVQRWLDDPSNLQKLRGGLGDHGFVVQRIDTTHELETRFDQNSGRDLGDSQKESSEDREERGGRNGRNFAS